MSPGGRHFTRHVSRFTMRAVVFCLVAFAMAVSGRLAEPKTNAPATPAFVETREKVLPVPPEPLVLGPIAAGAASDLMRRAVSPSSGRRVSVPGIGGVVSVVQYLMDMRANKARHNELKAMYPVVLEQLRALREAPELLLSRSVSNSVVKIGVILGRIRMKLFPKSRRRIAKLRTLKEYYDLYSDEKNIDDLQWQLSTVLQLLATEQGEQLKALVLSLDRFRLTLPRKASTTAFSESAAIRTLRSVEAASAAGADEAKDRMERFMGFRATRTETEAGGLFRKDGTVDPRISARYAKFVSRTLVDGLQAEINALANAHQSGRAAGALQRGIEEVLGPEHDGNTHLVRLLQRLYEVIDDRTREPLSPAARAYEVATLGAEVQQLLDEWKHRAELSMRDASGTLPRKNVHLWKSLAEAFSQTGVTRAATRTMARDSASRALCEAGLDTASAKCREAQLIAAEACQRTEWYLLTMLQSVLAAPMEGAQAGTRRRLCEGNVGELEAYLFRGRQGRHPMSYIVQENTTGDSYVDLCKYWSFNELLGATVGGVNGDEASSQATHDRDSSTVTGHEDGAVGGASDDDESPLPDAFATMPPASDDEGKLHLGQPEFAKHLEVYTSCHSHVQLASRIVLEMIARVKSNNKIKIKHLHKDALVDALVSLLFNIGVINHCAARRLVESRSDRNGPRLVHMAEQSVWSMLTAGSISDDYGIVVANVNYNALAEEEDVDSKDMDEGRGLNVEGGDDSSSHEVVGSPDSSAGSDGNVSEDEDVDDGSGEDAATGAKESPHDKKNDNANDEGVVKSLYDSVGRALTEEEVWLFVEESKGRVISVEPLAAIFARLRVILAEDNIKSTKTAHWKAFEQLWHGLIDVYGSLVIFDRSRMLLRESMSDIVWSGKETCTLKIRDADSKCLSYGNHLDITCGGSVWAAQLSKAVGASGSENLVGVKSLENSGTNGIWDDSTMLADAIVRALDLATLRRHQEQE